MKNTHVTGNWSESVQDLHNFVAPSQVQFVGSGPVTELRSGPRFSNLFSINLKFQMVFGDF